MKLSQQTSVIVLIGDVDGFSQGKGCGEGERYFDLGHILRVEGWKRPMSGIGGEENVGSQG